ncbi:hypothetical protein LSUE1_G000076 [Lachnellula suecica]|uniref:Uncharacterized protein n=1 Tax=Lachnellula suecica TaxID=602035 RepID=A0A8T9CM54_9HELO|nr:hypothetical protein LSUE1_G000076 [Lachnellula suecica]
MSEFHDAVSTLLEAFARGLSIIKAQKKRGSNQQTTKTAPEAHLGKSLKKNRRDVKDAYSRDLAQFGAGFAAGDAEARSSISIILSRLTTGFLSVIERFTKGRSSTSDYQALLNLSNTTRNETIHTFSQLSSRLSNSSFVSAPSNEPLKRHTVGKTSPRIETRKPTTRHTRAKSAPDLSVTPLGPASSSGWIRPKPGRRRPSKSQSLSSIDSRRKETSPKPISSTPQQLSAPTSAPQLTHRHSSSRRENRKSIMSFASDSTKLGEIPEYKWARPRDDQFPITTYYPLELYEEPVKSRSRFMRLFRK